MTTHVTTTRLRHAVTSAVLVFATCGVASAHPGHGTTAPTSADHLLEPSHLLPALGVGILLGLVLPMVYRKLRRP